jgi:competence protein ComFC
MLLRSLINILYPPLCLHCDNTLERKKELFCEACLELLSPIDPEGRCLTCFAEELPCLLCTQRPALLKRAASASHRFGPASTLSSYLQKGQTLFVPAAASLMALQFCALDWPMPDVIVPLPLSLWSRCKRGGDTHALLAKQIAHTFKTDYAHPLRAIGDKSHFLKTAEWRAFAILRERQEKILCDKRILLISLEYNDAALRQAAEALTLGGASQIYSLSLL